MFFESDAFLLMKSSDEMTSRQALQTRLQFSRDTLSNKMKILSKMSTVFISSKVLKDACPPYSAIVSLVVVLVSSCNRRCLSAFGSNC